MNILQVQNLSKQYPGFRLDRVSFDVEEGCIMGFIGRNGAGKTTTIKSILNLGHADGGSVLFEGRDLWANETECKKQIGLVLGEFSFYKRKKLKAIADVTKRFYPDWDEQTYQSGHAREVRAGFGAVASCEASGPRRADERSGPGLAR